MGVLLWWSCQSPVACSCGLLNHPNGFCGRMFKLIAKFDADFLLYLLGHFECNGHTVHILTQWRLPPPLTIRVKLSLFTHVRSNPRTLVARLHQCLTNNSHCIKSGWTFSWTDLVCINIYIRKFVYLWCWVFLSKIIVHIQVFFCAPKHLLEYILNKSYTSYFC